MSCNDKYIITPYLADSLPPVLWKVQQHARRVVPTLYQYKTRMSLHLKDLSCFEGKSLFFRLFDDTFQSPLRGPSLNGKRLVSVFEY